MLESYYKNIYNYLSKIHPNSKVYVISDHHFFHNNIIKYERTQFTNVEVMNEHIINSHNKTINKEDIVIFLGDFSFKKKEIAIILSKMNGHKYLMLGNHDKIDIIKNYHELGFESVFTTPVKFNDAYLSHYPLNTNEFNDIHTQLLLKEFNDNLLGINYHGHIHTLMSSNDRNINVTCEALDYIPLFIGYTGKRVDDEKMLLINSNIFNEILLYLRQEKRINVDLLIADYIYSTMLEANNDNKESCIIHGSFPQYKKYGYISNFSDIDVAVIYDENISKNKNNQKLKDITDNMYNSLLKIDNINLTFIKRIINMRAFKYIYMGSFVNKGALDANLIPINFYRDSDYYQVNCVSSLEKNINTNTFDLNNNYHLPSFNANFISNEGDIANLLLQLLFQKGYDNKKALVIKKLKYIYKHGRQNDNGDLDDILARFLLRNISFLHTVRRIGEIEYIKDKKIRNDFSLNELSSYQKAELDQILFNYNSKFNIIYQEIIKTPNEIINEKCKTLIKELKNDIK